jgi:ribosomal protein L11 methylase PrmA
MSRGDGKAMILDRKHILHGLAAATIVTACTVLSFSQKQQRPTRKPDVPFVISVDDVVDAMLKTANVTEKDIVYDLGCGDGRIVIAAAQKYGAHGVGIDINPKRISESRRNARRVGVTQQVRFVTQDFFKSDISPATVVAIYLDPNVNLRLRSKLQRELTPGTRIVSNSFDMGDWKPEKVVKLVVAGSECTIYYWVIPKRN